MKRRELDPRPQRIAICGAGPAGLAVAIHLARAGHEVSLVDRRDLAAVRVGEHVSPRGAALLRQLGLDLRQATFARPCPEVRSVWGDAEVRSSHSIFDPDGSGFLVTRPELDRRLAALAEKAGARVVTRTHLLDLGRQEGSWRLRLRRGGVEWQMEADFVIDATGRAAAVARRLGVRSLDVDRLVGLCGYLETTPADPWAVLVEATSDGWWYSAGLPDGSAVATFMTDGDTLPRGSRPAEAWHRRLASHTRERLGGERPSRIVVRAAHTRALERIAGPDWLAVGDSAASYDPLSSAGIEKALAHARAAAAAVGNPSAIAAYARRIGEEVSAYLEARERFYGAQRLWSDEPFWRRRAAGVARRGPCRPTASDLRPRGRACHPPNTPRRS